MTPPATPHSLGFVEGLHWRYNPIHPVVLLEQVALLVLHPPFLSFTMFTSCSPSVYCPHFDSTTTLSPSSAQKTVPSLSISIGGPPEAGRFCFAISRPPFQVALSRT